MDERKEPGITAEAVWDALREVMDPEIPVVSVVDMGIVRAVDVRADGVTVSMTPTFAGCPALDVMREEIERRVQRLGAASVEVKMVLAPPWTSDWITDQARAKLAAFGLAPPARHGGDVAVMLSETARCPRCGGAHVTLKNTFGSTLCRMIFYCEDCREPFEQFKPI
ncbi:MAG: 1,2-phenylacetyl-CoA epoxidase subunit PaaD [Armatimonadota bacterium]